MKEKMVVTAHEMANTMNASMIHPLHPLLNIIGLDIALAIDTITKESHISHKKRKITCFKLLCNILLEEKTANCVVLIKLATSVPIITPLIPIN